MTLFEQTGRPWVPTPVKWTGWVLAMAGFALSLMAASTPPGATSAGLAWLALIVPPVMLVPVALCPEVFEIRVRGSPRRAMNFAMALPAMGLAIVGVNAPLLDYQLAWIAAGTGAAFGLLLGLTLIQRPGLASPNILLLFMALFGAAYGGGAAVYADTRFDTDPGQAYTAAAEREYYSSGRHGGHYHVVLGAWGPIAEGVDARISGKTYTAFQNGATACVTLHHGALQLRWYAVSAC